MTEKPKTVLAAADALVKQGACVEQIHGVSLPLFYHDLESEIKAVRLSAGLYDASYYRVIRVAGSDAEKFLNNLASNNVKGLAIGRLQHSSFLDRKGKVRSLFSLLRVSQTVFFLIVQPDLLEKSLSILNEAHFIQDVMIKDESEQWGLLCLVGPKAVTCVGEALALHGDMLIDENKVIIPPDCSAWNLWKSERWAVPAIYLLLPRGQCQEAFNLMRAVDVPPVGKLAIDLVRLEAGIPEYGLEIDGQHILLEADLDDTFSREKGCYPGQEVIERISAYGNGKTPYKLNIYKIDSDVNSIDKITVDEDDRPVKQVMRFFYDPSENRTVVAAYVENR